LTKGKFIAGANIYIDGLTMALLQTKTEIFVFNYCNRKPSTYASFLVYETSKTTINVADFQNKRFTRVAIH
jgi:hypothetical protein